jgi:hypothetical protein
LHLTVIKRVLEGGEGVISAGRSDKSSESDFAPDDLRLSSGGVCICGEAMTILNVVILPGVDIVEQQCVGKCEEYRQVSEH